MTEIAQTVFWCILAPILLLSALFGGLLVAKVLKWWWR